ncbi:MAG: glycosyltransferase family 39 protein, partial [Phycisphaerae bacterium]
GDFLMKRGLGLWIVLLLGVHAAGLTCDLSEPWVGMHDWNGAFFSQLARNYLRYPASVHHGMPLVAVGAKTPSQEERSIYATHPPGLVWLLAGWFRLFGESEASARMLPIGASLASLAMLMWLVSRGYGLSTAILTGAIYGVMPMAVYFGRMVDHEAVCLMCMLGMTATGSLMRDAKASPSVRSTAMAAWALFLILGVFVDWSVVLFAGIFCLSAARDYRSKALPRHLFAGVLACSATAISGMMTYVVYAGLDGRWGDWIAIFLSRSVEEEGGALLRDGAMPGGVWLHTLDNLGGPVALLAAAGAVVSLKRWITMREVRRESPSNPPDTPNRGEEGGAVSESESAAARRGLWMIFLTGLLWVAVFRRQYERHHYWLFYLGPAAALFSARGMIALWDGLKPKSAKAATIVAGLALIITVVFESRGTREYFARTAFPPAAVEDWRRIREMTAGGDRVLLFRNPIRIELRGGYRFRNIVPPQIAYYLDRRLGVERDFERVADQAGSFAVFVIPSRDADLFEPAWRGPLGRFRRMSLEGKVVFDLRSPGPAHQP